MRAGTNEWGENTKNDMFLQDNPAFQVKAAETIGVKKTVSISVGYKQHSGSVPSTADRDKDEGPTSSGGGSRRERAERAEREREREKAEKADKTGSTAILSGPKPPSTAAQSKVGRLTVTHVGSNVVWIYYLKLG